MVKRIESISKDMKCNAFISSVLSDDRANLLKKTLDNGIEVCIIRDVKSGQLRHMSLLTHAF